jgi:hypothetical protein
MKTAAKYVCWVAGLAIALGIWAWLASMPGPASAGPGNTWTASPGSARRAAPVASTAQQVLN